MCTSHHTDNVLVMNNFVIESFVFVPVMTTVLPKHVHFQNYKLLLLYIHQVCCQLVCFIIITITITLQKSPLHYHYHCNLKIILLITLPLSLKLP